MALRARHDQVQQARARLTQRGAPSGDDSPRVCAWCGRVKENDVWREVELAEAERARITHGICPDCRERVEEVLDAEAS